MRRGERLYVSLCVSVRTGKGLGPADFSPQGKFLSPGWDFSSHLTTVGGTQ